MIRKKVKENKKKNYISNNRESARFQGLRGSVFEYRKGKFLLSVDDQHHMKIDDIEMAMCIVNEFVPPESFELSSNPTVYRSPVRIFNLVQAVCIPNDLSRFVYYENDRSAVGPGFRLTLISKDIFSLAVSDIGRLYFHDTESVNKFMAVMLHRRLNGNNVR